ncbi:hypothetical protein AGIG_G9717 [Arapaima gigas]
MTLDQLQAALQAGEMLPLVATRVVSADQQHFQSPRKSNCMCFVSSKKISSLQPSPPSCLAPGVDPPPGLAVPLTCCSGENENLLNFRIAHIYRSREGPKSTGVSCDGGLTLFRGVFPRIRKESAAGVQTYLDLAQHWLLQVD